MQRRNTITMFALALCVALATAFCPAMASAKDNTNTLIVCVAEKEFFTDIQTHGPGLVADVYQIATATYDADFDTYSYTMVEPFTNLQESLDDARTGAGDWTKLSESAVELVGKATPVAKGVAMTDSGARASLEDGLYLVFVHGANEATGTTTAKSTDYDYVFQSSIVALPTKFDKNGTMEGPIGTDPSFGEWQNEVTIYPKASREKHEEPPTPPNKLVQTGDLANPWVMAAIGGIGVALLGVGYVVKKRKDNKE